MTRARQTVLDILTGAEHPVSAAYVMARIGTRFDQATVYRALRWLEEQGHAESFVLHCTEHGTERFYTGREGGCFHHHWFHCEACHTFTDLGRCSLEALTAEYQERHRVAIRSHTLYFTGLCASCR